MPEVGHTPMRRKGAGESSAPALLPLCWPRQSLGGTSESGLATQEEWGAEPTKRREGGAEPTERREEGRRVGADPGATTAPSATGAAPRGSQPLGMVRSERSFFSSRTHTHTQMRACAKTQAQTHAHQLLPPSERSW